MSLFRTDKANFLFKGDNYVELGIVHDGAHRADMYSLAVTQLALSIRGIKGISLHRHNLGLEEVAKLESELHHSLHKVERLGKISRDLERERNVG